MFINLYKATAIIDRFKNTRSFAPLFLVFKLIMDGESSDKITHFLTPPFSEIFS